MVSDDFDSVLEFESSILEMLVEVDTRVVWRLVIDDDDVVVRIVLLLNGLEESLIFSLGIDLISCGKHTHRNLILNRVYFVNFVIIIMLKLFDSFGSFVVNEIACQISFQILR